MQSILVAVENQAMGRTLQNVLASTCETDLLVGPSLEILESRQDRLYEILFLEIDLILRTAKSRRSLKEMQSVLAGIWRLFPSVEIIILTPPERIRETVSIIRAGASTYLTYPIVREEVLHELEDLDESKYLQLELDYLRDRFWQDDSLEVVTTNSPKMQAIFNKVRTVAGKKVTVLLTGETGTGKGLLAKLLHRHSERKEDQFISVHCGAIPDSLLESELFGHEKGAFTGATERKLGRFEVADGGTLFLDEVGTISQSMQVKLLQVLQDKQIRRLGSPKDIDVDVRIIAATNEDLNQRRLEGTFRSDLFYRLNVFPIELPALRERREDIPLLTDTFLSRLNLLYQKEIHYIHANVLDAFQHYEWPGNIRELENLIERAYLLEESSILTEEAFPSDLFEGHATRTDRPVDTNQSLSSFRQSAYHVLEQRYLNDLLTRCEGKIGLSAKAAGITERQLHRLMVKHSLNKADFKPPSTTRH